MYGEELIGHSISSGRLFVMDTSKLDSIANTMRLMDILFPIAVAAALLIVCFMCCLLILKSMKDAAIMRILGVTKGKTRAVLVLEQSVLCIIGIAIGLVAMLGFNRFEFDVAFCQLLFIAVLVFVSHLLCGIICSSLATRKPPLELLSVKE